MIYHVTTADALASIMGEGIVPRIGPRSAEQGEMAPAVYAFSSTEAVEDALCGWLGEVLADDTEIFVIEIDMAAGPEPGSFEVVLTETVPPALFRRIIDESLWEAEAPAPVAVVP